uniref:Pescadillo homolog n=1 Tax=Gorilla gorilla gorilla TaxID=9595 RepID=G3RNT5_GORGO
GGLGKKNYERGSATNYITQNKAQKKLQLSLADFRQLCILKGIYPHELKHKKKVNKRSTAAQTFYLIKDIRFLLHEPIINKFWEYKVLVQKLLKAYGKSKCKHCRPNYKLDYIIKEWYPTFIDALQDLDNALSMCFLFSTFPRTGKGHVQTIHHGVFLSIKGIYYQVKVLGQPIMSITTYAFSHDHPTDMDYRVMLNLHYPLKLEGQASEGTHASDSEISMEKMAALTASLARVVVPATEEEPEVDEFPANGEMSAQEEDRRKELEGQEKHKKLSEGLKFFLNRGVPCEALAFVISFWGEVSWDKSLCIGATYDITDSCITHQIVDWPGHQTSIIGRCYMQPQWVTDSVNARLLLLMAEYFPGVQLPPHLSPFVTKEGDYIPPEKLRLLALQQGEDPGILNASEEEEKEDNNNENDGDEGGENEEEEEEKDAEAGSKKEEEAQLAALEEQRMKGKTGTLKVEDERWLAQEEESEAKHLAIMMMRKWEKYLYQKIMFGKRRKIREANKLVEKRKAHDEVVRSEKKAKKARLE